ncbi:MAG: CDP-glycerol glycerophosphotransferase family protein [Bifidobacteriaceae bacterium]|jgi:hypothetical protein|nr:CDP-glycerol glycerophosphotransferase family protein [Bifidobacteriaceae bacterium]
MSKGRLPAFDWRHGRRAVFDRKVVATKTLALAVKAVRASGLLPKSIPDGYGDEKQLAAKPLGAQIIVYFADTVVGLYQLRAWYPALRALHRAHRLVVIGTDSRAVKAIRQESGLPAFTISHYSSIDLVLARNPVRLALYINHNAANFSLMAFPQLIHVSIMHGDSDKIVSVSGQTKAYDFTFVAGQAAIDRLAAHLPLFDAAQRCVIIGRPQVDPALIGGTSGQAKGTGTGRNRRKGTASGKAEGTETVREGGKATASDKSEKGRKTVLYAPTWEGGTDSAAYSSLAAYGERIAAAMLADRRFRLIYRPHPLTGSRLARFGQADARVRQLVEAAAKANPAAGHAVSRGGDAAGPMGQADLLISDVSSLAIDFLVTGRPLTITIPPDRAALVAPTPLLELTPRLGPPELGRLADFLGTLISDDPGADDRAAVTGYYLGDTRPGAAVAAFVDACGQMIDLAEANLVKYRLAPPGSGEAA